METIKVAPWGEGQGEYVLINKSDFNPDLHKLFEAVSAPAPTRDDVIAALAALPGDYTDPEYVIKHMRKHFGELFLDVDEETIRNTVKSTPPKPSDGLSVDELKAKLTAKGIAIPAGARKPDLAKLLDEAPE